MKVLRKKSQLVISTALGLLLTAGLISGPNVYAGNANAQSSATENAPPVCKNSYSLISYDLRPRSVPRFIKALQGDLAMNAEQKQQLKKITQYVPKHVLPMRQKIKAFEKTVIAEFVENGKTPQALATQLDKLTKMKRDLAIEEIQVFNQLKKLLTPEQYQTAIHNAGWQP